MADSRNGELGWYLPKYRGIIEPERFHIPRRLAKTIRQRRFRVTVNIAFADVIRACAEPAPGREDTWISDEIIALYQELHDTGFAHSIECWQGGKLVGGLYGIAIRGLFAGESMFSRTRDASKVALVELVQRLRAGGFTLLDTQFYTPHLGQFGAIEIPDEAYQVRLQRALMTDARFPVGSLFDGG
ncbi:MAG: leucyl/phenylalanyl-tRNA--protein transferase [Candidatus Dadabacteria bacterium]|nr:MAG: leucyl/phenylalanyl-tRNA--protein transferase [Candidatus Dadabacteria bacterium]